MQSPDDVELRDGFAVTGSRGLECLFKRHRVSAGGIFLATKCTKPASRNADVGRVQMAIDVEIGLVSMHGLANVIGQPADGEEVGTAIERKGIVTGKTLAGQDFVMNRPEPGVVGLKGMLIWHQIS